MARKTFLVENAGQNRAASSVLDKEWDYYTTNRDKIIKEYRDKYVVISGDRVVAAYDTRKEAYHETTKHTPLGSFMIHHATDPEEVIQLSPFAYD